MDARQAVLLAASLTLVFGAQAGVYKWVDEQGNVHFSEQRPAQRSVESVDIKTRRVSPERSEWEMEKLREKAGLNPPPDTKKTKKVQGESPEQKAKREAALAENCRRAKINLRNLEAMQHALTPDASGKLVRMSYEQREAKLQGFRQQVNEYCQ